MTMQIDQYNRMSLADFRAMYATLQPPQTNLLQGIHRGVFVGPAWVRVLVRPALWISGLGGWWGKRFSSGGQAINLVQRNGAFAERFPMLLLRQISLIDGKSTLALHYSPRNPLPWPLIVDELRRIDDQWLLGMTMLNLGPLRRLALPFLLARQPDGSLAEI